VNDYALLCFESPQFLSQMIAEFVKDGFEPVGERYQSNEVLCQAMARGKE
jgi:hypothetical protein